MNKIITAGCVAVAAFAAVAMPNKRELADARRIVEDVSKADLAAFKAGKKSAKDVADAHISLAEKVENEAEKYLLYQGAFKLYARCEEYDLAADALQSMNRNVKDVPPEVIAELIGDELRYVPDNKTPQLVAMLKEAKRANPAEDSTEKTRKSVAKLFPGWSLDTEVYQHEVTGFHANHRGQDNVVCVHPKDMRTPAIISRTIILSDKNPCLFLKVASWNEESDYLLSVRVNGKEALTQRLIRTPDSAPWEDVIVPLSDWRGSKVKIEVVFAANGWHAWWPENPMLARLEIGEGGDADEKLYLDVIAELRRKGGSEKERANIVLSKLFPGWTLAAGERIGDTGGFVASHRGKNNVFYSHPISRELPMILSREMKLPVKNPCLFLTVSSFDQKSDCLLTVRVNGKDALPARRINTPDNAPWEDVVVPLSAWSGQKVKIELVHSANNWYCEHLYLSRIKIAAGNGQKKFVPAAIEMVDGYAWSYRVNNGEAEIVSEQNGNYSCAILPMPKGHLTIPASLGNATVRCIGKNAFRGCAALTSVMIPDGVKSIADNAFYKCSGLSEVTIPSSVTNIGMGAFGGCSVKVANIPYGVTGIGMNPFTECKDLMSISVDPKNPSYSSRNGMLCTKDGTTLISGIGGNVTIPSGVKILKRDAFKDHSRLVLVSIPESVTHIGRSAFCGCNGLKSITIPSGVKTMESGVFLSCGELAAVTFSGERPDAPDTVFRDCPTLTAIHVPANAKSWAGMKEWQGKPLVFDAK